MQIVDPVKGNNMFRNQPCSKMVTRASLAALCIGIGGLMGLMFKSPVQANDSETYRELRLFGDVFERVRAEYVEEVTDKDLIEAAINGMLTSLDPHSSFLNKDNYQDMQVQTRGEFGGLGIEVTMENGFVKVVSPIDDTPAFRAGLKGGDYISHLDGESVLGLTLTEAVDKMRGLVDTDLTLTIRRQKKEPFDVTLTRAVIKIQSVRYRAEGDIGYVRITTFNEQTETGLLKGIKRLKEDIGPNLKGFVLDLRNNPGGLLDQAIAVSDAFLGKGEIVSTRGRDKDDVERRNAESGDVADGLPVVVLINGGSASASEIVAGALKDHRRAILLGTRSFGKGSVQTIMPLPGQNAMRLTTARYYTPSGTSIQAKGIEPDIEVKPAKLEEFESGTQRREENLRGALQNTDKESSASSENKTSDTKDTQTPEKPFDYQLERAKDLIQGMSLFKVTLK